MGFRFLSIALLLVGPAFVQAARPAIVDRAKLFTPAVVERANHQIDDIRQQYGIGLWLDTFTELPGKAAEELPQYKSRSKKNALYHRVALELAEQEGVDGLYVLVTTEPPNTTVVGWPSAASEGRTSTTFWRPSTWVNRDEGRESEARPIAEGGGLSRVKRDKLREDFARDLGTDPDRALLALVSHFQRFVKQRASVAPSPLGTLPALIVVGALLGVWLMLSLFRRLAARRQAFATGEPAVSRYQPALLGSLFGMPSAFWIYDRLFNIQRPRADLASASVPVPVDHRLDHHIQQPPTAISASPEEDHPAPGESERQPESRNDHES
jgi:hypothetical protein